jgi:diaminopimelate epimerase
MAHRALYGSGFEPRPRYDALMRLPFTKMHGLGNDFIVFQASAGLPDAARLRALANRHTGIGFDQALALYPARRAGTDLYYRIFNADGTEVEQCGNGARCVAAHVVACRGPVNGAPTELTMDSPGGIVRARVAANGVVAIAMGVPDFRPGSLPFLAEAEADTYALELISGQGPVLNISAVSIGNPHAVLIVEDVDRAPVDSIGPAVEYHQRFANRTNVGFVQIVSEAHIRLRVHERGVGETQACGTGACAAVAVGRRLGLLASEVAVDLPGGRLTIEWPGADDPIWLTGPTATAFEGHTEL